MAMAAVNLEWRAYLWEAGNAERVRANTRVDSWPRFPLPNKTFFLGTVGANVHNPG